MFDNIDRSHDNDSLSISEIYTDIVLSDTIKFCAINRIDDKIRSLKSSDKFGLYEIRTPLGNLDLALREADVALRLYGHRRIGVDVRPEDGSDVAAARALDQLADLCRRRGAVLILYAASREGSAPPRGVAPARRSRTISRLICRPSTKCRHGRRTSAPDR